MSLRQRAFDEGREFDIEAELEMQGRTRPAQAPSALAAAGEATHWQLAPSFALALNEGRLSSETAPAATSPVEGKGHVTAPREIAGAE